jgi:RNA polymerase sigma factor for flagellar operon FliA
MARQGRSARPRAAAPAVPRGPAPGEGAGEGGPDTPGVADGAAPPDAGESGAVAPSLPPVPGAGDPEAGAEVGTQDAMAERQGPLAAPAARGAYGRRAPVDEAAVLRHLPLVKHVAARLALGLPNHIDLDDLYSYGVFGLLDALQKFDPQRGVKFETYAFTRIRGAILDGLRAMDWVPTSLRQRARQVEEAYARVEARLGRAAEDAEVAAELGMRLGDFQRLMQDMERASLLSLDELWGEDSGEEYTLHELVRDEAAVDPTQSAEWRNREEILAAAVEALPARERAVVTLFYYDGLVPKEIATVLGVSVSRISQLHARAVMRLKGRLWATQRSLL